MGYIITWFHGDMEEEKRAILNYTCDNLNEFSDKFFYFLYKIKINKINFYIYKWKLNYIYKEYFFKKRMWFFLQIILYIR